MTEISGLNSDIQPSISESIDRDSTSIITVLWSWILWVISHMPCRACLCWWNRVIASSIFQAEYWSCWLCLSLPFCMHCSFACPLAKLSMMYLFFQFFMLMPSFHNLHQKLTTVLSMIWIEPQHMMQKSSVNVWTSLTCFLYNNFTRPFQGIRPLPYFYM